MLQPHFIQGKHLLTVLLPITTDEHSDAEATRRRHFYAGQSLGKINQKGALLNGLNCYMVYTRITLRSLKRKIK